MSINTVTKNMQSYQASDAADALRLLADTVAEREADLRNFQDTSDQESSDEEADSPSPIFDSFYNEGGAEAIRQMTNFDVHRFEDIWNIVHDHVSRTYNVGRGQRCSVTGKDALFITFCVLKHGGHWDVLSRMFKLKAPTFERLVSKFIQIISSFLYKEFVTNASKEYNMSTLNQRKQLFRSFPYALYATDVTFQQSYRPSGSVDEGKRYYSGKHKLYGYKVEVSVMPNGLCISSSQHYPGSVSDFEIFQRMKEWHVKHLRKKVGDADIPDHGLHADEHPEMWAVMADKGYQGILDICRGVTPIKKRPNGHLSLSDIAFNRKLSSDRIIVENYFGRLCSLWALLSQKWRWNESMYDDYFKLALALTNVHILWLPLRYEDNQRFQRARNRLIHIANEQVEKRRQVLNRYQERRRHRLGLQFRNTQHESRPSTFDFP